MKSFRPRLSIPGLLLGAVLASACSGPDGDDSIESVEDTDVPEPLDDTQDTDITPLLLRADTWPAILRNSVELINGEQPAQVETELRGLYANLSAIFVAEAINGAPATTSTALGLTQLALADADEPNALNYSCNNGGALAITVLPDQSFYNVQAASCALEGDVHDGTYVHNGVGREGVLSELQGLSIAKADGTSLAIEGSFSTNLSRIGFTVARNWRDTQFNIDDGQSTLTVDNYNIESTAQEGVDPNNPQRQAQLDDGTPVRYTIATLIATTSGSFDVSAAWTEGQTLSVSTTLGMDSSYATWLDNGEMADALNLANPTIANNSDGSSIAIYRYPRTVQSTQWSSGNIEILAEDGSRVTLTPSDTESTAALVRLGDDASPVFVDWNDGFQVRCIGNEMFSDCL